jgi:hypothetical protein
MVSKLKDHTSWGMIQAMERASERVDSWPEWKKAAFSLRHQESEEPLTLQVHSCSPDTPKEFEK